MPVPDHLEPDHLERGANDGGRARGRLRHVRRLLYASDLAMVGLAMAAAHVLRYGPSAVLDAPAVVGAMAVLAIGISAVGFPLTNLYRAQWRYASMSDLLAIARAAGTASLLVWLATLLDPSLRPLPAEVVGLHTLLVVALLGATRLGLRADEVQRVLGELLGTRTDAKNPRVPVLLIGAGDGADVYLRALARDPAAMHVAVGVLDDDPATHGSTLRGVPVLGAPEDLGPTVERLRLEGHAPQHLVFTGSPAALGTAAERLLDSADALGIAVSRVTSPLDLREPGEVATELRRVELSDLLERPQAQLDRKAVALLIAGRTVAVTGAGGSIGSELVRQVVVAGAATLVLIENCEFNLYTIDREIRDRWPELTVHPCLCDIRDEVRVAALLRHHRPHVVFNAAALKHVPMVEMNPCEGVLTNVMGTRNVALAAREAGAAAFVQVSTDKAVDSTSVMGATKRVGEQFGQALDLQGDRTRFITVRFGNVLGSSGSLIPLFREQLEAGGPLTVTHPEMTRFFMTIREAVELTLQASARGLADALGLGTIFVLDMGEPVRIMDIAERMIRLSGRRVRDVGIRVIGCRPGEKLFEELFGVDEERMPSRIAGVLEAASSPQPLSRLQDRIDVLVDHARAGREREVIEALRELLPNYHPARDAIEPMLDQSAPDPTAPDPTAPACRTHARSERAAPLAPSPLEPLPIARPTPAASPTPTAPPEAASA